MKNLVRNYKKTRKKSRFQKPKRSDIKYFLTIDFMTETTQKYANVVDTLLFLHFLNYFFLIFQISIFQRINCRNLNDELNCSYNGGGVVHLLQSDLPISSLQYIHVVMFCGYHPIFVNISGLCGYYPDLLKISAFSGYIQFRGYIRISWILSALATLQTTYIIMLVMFFTVLFCSWIFVLVALQAT